jgi:signal transduction histidine kinase/DNA-binding LacI/PurR family transcriptional regulator/CheY-like chemotaxis protein
MQQLTTRPTLGLLTHGATDPNSRAVWAGVAAAAREHDSNLICFPGRAIGSKLGFEAQANVLYELAGKQNIDGVLLWMAALSHRADPAEVTSFPRRYAPLPTVTIGLDIPGESRVIIDNYSGMEAIVEHVVGAHGRRRPAFILGPERHWDAEDRFRAYCAVLERYDIRVREELLAQGDFKEAGGAAAAEILLQRGAPFDALIAASDNMAIGALRTLQAAGLRVPDDVAVAGVNDESQSAFVSPPLTTAALWFYEQGYRATVMLLAKLAGRQVEERVVLPPQLVVRQSCGCADPLIARAADVPGDFPDRDHCVAALRELADAAGPLHAEHVERLGLEIMDGCASELERGARGSFLAALRDALNAGASAGIPVSTWQDVLSLLWRELGNSGRGPVGDRQSLWQQARIMIGETGQRLQAYHALQAEEQARRLSRIDQALSTTVDLDGLQEVLANALPALGIPACWLALYEDVKNPSESARLLMGYDQNGRLEVGAESRTFPTTNLVPTGVLDPEKRHSLVVQPLFFREDQLGLLVFEADPQQEEVYELLGGAISGALKRTQLLARNVELYKEAVRARLAAEEGRRLAEDANMLKSRFLATVSHELRTPLSLIVGTIEMMKREAERVRGLPDSYRHDLTSIHLSAQHLSRLISDVLDLASGQAGELQLSLRPVLVGDLLERVSALGEPMARAKGLDWRTDIPRELPLIIGDRTRLQQVALNLVANAVKFTESGAITLWAEVGNEQVIIAVSDTGLGIPAGEQEFIFDEFRQSRTAAQRGYGGMGLGLAISKRLIELHGGQIGVLSSGSEGAGSTFYFTLPVGRVVPAHSQRPAERGHKVLLLTERPGDGGYVQAYLEARGFEVEPVAAADTPDWLEAIVASPPGALVLDYEPATERGWELIETLKRDPNTCELPILFYALRNEGDTGVLLTLDYLTKPVGEDRLAAALDRQGLTGRGRKPAVLIVDDDSGVLEMHARMVQKRLPEARILRASDGAKALEILRQTRPDLVLLDLMMPVMDGFTVLERMRDERVATGVPVIVLTAQILTGRDMQRLQQGVTAVLGKGVFTADEVLRQVEQALARSRRLGPEAQRVVRQAMAYIHEHYAEDFSRSDLAGSLSINERYLTRCFHDETGLTPFAYLARYRINRAKELLDATSLSITDIAQMTGFADASHFSRTFQREIGLAPRAYRSRA